MSLLKQLWLIVLVPGALALAGALAVVVALGKPHFVSSASFVHADAAMAPMPTPAPDWFVDLANPVLTSIVAFTEHGNSAQMLWQGATRLTLVFVATLLLGLALAWWVVRHLRRSLARLEAQASELGRQRFSTARLPQTREVRQATRALNRLSERLRADAIAQKRQGSPRRHSDTSAEPALSVHLSDAARGDATFFNRLQDYLQAHGVPLLALESQAAEDGLQALTLPFVKLEGALLAEAQGQSRHRERLGDIVALCHTAEVLVIAQGASSSRERAALLDLGVDGIAGVALAPCEATLLSA
jgi:EAL domain-containing protein (putative c-di-GMP-specific phosphodiesterase class I)